jgi:hypothetical protein
MPSTDVPRLTLPAIGTGGGRARTSRTTRRSAGRSRGSTTQRSTYSADTYTARHDSALFGKAASLNPGLSGFLRKWDKVRS